MRHSRPAPGRLADPADVEACRRGPPNRPSRRASSAPRTSLVVVPFRVSTTHAHSPQKAALNTQRSESCAISGSAEGVRGTVFAIGVTRESFEGERRAIGCGGESAGRRGRCPDRSGRAGRGRRRPAGGLRLPGPLARPVLSRSSSRSARSAGPSANALHRAFERWIAPRLPARRRPPAPRHRRRRPTVRRAGRARGRDPVPSRASRSSSASASSAGRSRSPKRSIAIIAATTRIHAADRLRRGL